MKVHQSPIHTTENAHVEPKQNANQICSYTIFNGIHMWSTSCLRNQRLFIYSLCSNMTQLETSGMRSVSCCTSVKRFSGRFLALWGTDIDGNIISHGRMEWLCNGLCKFIYGQSALAKHPACLQLSRCTTRPSASSTNFGAKAVKDGWLWGNQTICWQRSHACTKCDK